MIRFPKPFTRSSSGRKSVWTKLEENTLLPEAKTVSGENTAKRKAWHPSGGRFYHLKLWLKLFDLPPLWERDYQREFRELGAEIRELRKTVEHFQSSSFEELCDGRERHRPKSDCQCAKLLPQIEKVKDKRFLICQVIQSKGPGRLENLQKLKSFKVSSYSGLTQEELERDLDNLVNEVDKLEKRRDGEMNPGLKELWKCLIKDSDLELEEVAEELIWLVGRSGDYEEVSQFAEGYVGLYDHVDTRKHLNCNSGKGPRGILCTVWERGNGTKGWITPNRFIKCL
ncbi:hypothetical protein BJ508DRAFT_2812 [Ascobolus immersus RN42]|uniref:Uncharacterized protein n=1 Tax=Ascobolus immersus RN42 TaxID=1160509 RepID=A0A3N4IQX9_ASCIM|nr:hypothetical protein BJ508DRAFT_2812 [Ascobolus immersus RN42]